nr:Chain C, ARG-THR-LYS-GLN-THR-ALA-ARG [synthetic construct]6ISO_D Chain D, ARG-THR-LYS-GLN-THR-ALA-ARG [synthetic construct]6ISO_F Chain F, ARG-THR-LYS-GLN-THR-ALA-ARG [synthetic construct]6ISO_H Chain H, ARG-THR-LYS-GLN-THR-ALA-ARG [synthetic construct]6ISO_J Chain J, ARG-THR-LYS-GLN-THR-ALA-ARG [synthetic construct]6ISO_L Chain L, ARG-THR-LYS-GLN-THR-ALA-ARG [synthetic construct]
RTKQTAR